MNRLENESYLAFVERSCQALIDGRIGYEEWASDVIGEQMYSAENLRRCAQFFVRFIDKLDKEEIKCLNNERRVQELKKAKLDLEKERKKLQTINLEYQQTIREQSRDDLFYEMVQDSISRLEPLEVKNLALHVDASNKTGLLCVSDLHAGSTFKVNGIYGEVVNEYSMDIMKARMWKLAKLLIEDYQANITIDFDDIVIAFTGDLFENVLRMSSLYKLRDPVIDTVIETSEFLSTWINYITNNLSVPVKVVVVGGNHDTVSMLGQRQRPEQENLSKLVQKFMELRLEPNSLITVEPYSDAAYQNIRGVNVLFEHGEDQNLQTTIEYFSNLYNIDIDEVISGHLHRPESKAIGITEIGDRMIYRVGSIIGTDTYAKKIRKSARPSAYFALYDDENGHTWSRNYYL